MLQSFLSSPNMELLSAVDNNLMVASPWSFDLVNYADLPGYQTAAMEAIFSQASLGLMSTSGGFQALAHHGLLNHPSVLEGMDETQVNLPAPSCVDPGLSSNSATTTSPSIELDHHHKPPCNIYSASKHATKVNNMMLSFSNDPCKGQAGMCTKRRSWQEALSSPPPPASSGMSDNVASSSESCPRVIYSANDSKSSIASLAYPCTLVGSTHDVGEEDHTLYPNMDMATYMNPIITSSSKEMGGSGGQLSKGGLQISVNHEGQFSKAISIDDNIGSSKEMIMGSASIPPDHGSALFKGMNNSCHLSFYKEAEALPLKYHQNEKEYATARTASPGHLSPPTNPNGPRKRPASASQLPSSSASNSKRAHLQNVKGGMSTSITTTTTTPTTTTSTTTRSNKSSSRNPQGPALNTNGKPRAPQGCANDPQSVAARNRRERINARLKVLQELVPNGSKVDLVTMLEKAINYVKYLQLQLRVLSNDDLWQASQDNISEQGGAVAGGRSEEAYSRQNNIACSDHTSEAHYTYGNMGDTVYNP